MNKKTKRLGNRATKAELREAHRIKMELKNAAREFNNKRALADKEWIFANLSQNHPHFGDTPAEHAKRKLQENSA